MKLSIIVPVYNEEKTVAEILRRIQAVELDEFEKEIIVVDDGSTDNSKEEIEKYSKKVREVKLVEKTNGGKGTAVRKGIEKATGELIIIQDADLEYDPKDIPALLSAYDRKRRIAVYGTRLKRKPNFKRDERTFRFAAHFFGNKLLSLITSILYGQWVTDMETGYKLFPKKALEGIKLNSKSFDLEPEITAKLLKKNYTIVEIPITTNPRDYAHGKKLNTIRDGSKALWALIKYRFID